MTKLGTLTKLRALPYQAAISDTYQSNVNYFFHINIGYFTGFKNSFDFSENVETHSKFCTYTRSLLEVLFGVSTDKAANEPSLMNKMTKVDIVSKTPITFNKDEIYNLLHSSLLE